MLWAEVQDEKGKKRVPLDASAPCYQVVSKNQDKVVALRRTDVFVNHFNTCKFANDFNKAGKEKIEARAMEDPNIR